MIRSFADATTQDIWDGTNSKAARRIPNQAWKVARRKIDAVDRALAVEELKTPPSNQLHELRGDRKGTWSIKVNDQYRITFTFASGDAFDVCCEDYHDD